MVCQVSKIVEKGMLNVGKKGLTFLLKSAIMNLVVKKLK